ncbi:efflux RND transporter permease subunit [Methylocystis sp. MJC1]|uniref:efflux RND transporter permease subunit n=1 Tax=Methylocystis sp. MJC1 TaxID=2654282 RepID=UPI0019D0331B|nr:efflux RND transporter permease subunit [Methylocystis sp. MJC1]KAF2991194.1 Efflux pump membrane transporter BepE [Methylocystis sp. MJC1]MBU6526262.1 efflux RND transporter permease subunit [Methylocystis sp. MJC1]UZX12717.1 efflux RND transporter permease subunit [Methylocystis sp. MJC1]
MAFTDLFIRRPILAIVLALLILIAGSASLALLPVRQYPKLQSAAITIETSYPGATQQLMLGFVTAPLAQAVATADGVEYLTSISTEGKSLIKARLKIDANPDRTLAEIIAKVQQTKYLLPREVFDPIIEKMTDDPTAIMYVALMSETLSAPEMTDYATRTVQPLVASINGVASAQVMGGRKLAMRVWLDPEKLAGHDITAAEVATALSRNNVQIAAGEVKGAFTVSPIAANSDARDPESFRRLVLKAGPGLVRLEDVAVVDFGEQNYEQSAMINGRPAVVIAVNGTPAANPLDIVRDVDTLLPQLERSKPLGLDIENVFDVARFVKAALVEVEHTLIEAAIIVVIVIFLFLGSARAVLIPVMTIPLSLIGVAALMLIAGFSLNLLTLLAMVLAIGLVVDDAIVVVENVYRHIERGADPFEASLLGAREVVGPVIAMTVTLAAVYAPIGLMGGLTGSLFREFAFTLAGAVVVSGLAALCVSPVMGSLLLQPQTAQSWIGAATERGFHRLAGGYVALLKATLSVRPLMIVVSLATAGSVFFLYSGVKREFAPSEDQGTVMEVAKAPRYANLDYTESYSSRLEEAFQRLPERDTTWVLNGSSQTEPGPRGVFAGVNLIAWGKRQRSAATIMAELQADGARNPGLNVFAFLLPALPTSPGLPVQMVLFGSADFDQIYEVSQNVAESARGSGLFAVVDSDLSWDKPGSTLTIDRSKASELGLTMEDIAGALATLVGEKYVNRFEVSGRSYDVIPQVERRFRADTKAIGRFYVRTSSGSLLPLDAVLESSEHAEPNQLSQYNQMNSATISAVLSPGVTMGQAVAFLQKKADELPPGFGNAWLGESRQYVAEGNRLMIAFGLALLVIFLVLAAQFDSFRDPFVILVGVPLSMFGALLPLWFGYATLNIFTQIGLITLVGLISKHGILMTAFANELQWRDGLSREAAIVESARIRLRPILMTTAAMVAGLFPLIFANGAGGASRFAIGIVVVMGMLIGTFFTLFILPTIYVLLAQDHRRQPTAAV